MGEPTVAVQGAEVPKKGSRAKVLLSIIAMVIVVLLGLRVDALLTERVAILTNPALEGEVEYDGDVIDRRIWVLKVVAKAQMPIWDYFLINRSTSVLWGIIYALAGLAGGIAAFWLRQAGYRKAGDSQGNMLLRLVLAAFSGVLTHLILQLPGPFLARFVSVEVPGSGATLADGSFAGSMLALAVLAGLFGATFFDSIEGSYLKMFSKKEG